MIIIKIFIEIDYSLHIKIRIIYKVNKDLIKKKVLNKK